MVGIMAHMLLCSFMHVFSRDKLTVTMWTVTHQALLTMEFSSKNIGVGCHFLLQRIFLAQGSSPVSPALAGRFFTTAPPGDPHYDHHMVSIPQFG